MADKVHKTRGIILRNIKYGETSIIVTVYTELFGLQSYLQNGVRALSKTGGSKLVFFQPAAILEMDVYHNEFKQLSRIKEYRWGYLYKNIFTDVIKHGVAAYMVELLGKCLKQPESNSDLFAFVEDCLEALDSCSDSAMANFPVFFAAQLTNFFGFLPGNISADRWQSKELIFDIEEGVFTEKPAFHNLQLERKYALVLAELLQVRRPSELIQIETNAEIRRKILEAMELYYSLHIQDFGKMKTLQVLKEILR